MSFPRRGQIVVQYATRNWRLTDRDKDDWERGLEALGRVVDTFPTVVLHVHVERASRSGDFDVRLDLVLARSLRLFARETDRDPWPAYRRCVRRLVAKVRRFKEQPSGRQRDNSVEVPGTHVRAPVAPDLARIDDAVEAGDFAEFRDAMGIYYDTLRKRVGRRIALQPQVRTRPGRQASIDDCVEAVFLDAFESWNGPELGTESLGEWLERRIDPALRRLSWEPGALRNLDFLRSARRGRDGA